MVLRGCPEFYLATHQNPSPFPSHPSAPGLVPPRSARAPPVQQAGDRTDRTSNKQSNIIKIIKGYISSRNPHVQGENFRIVACQEQATNGQWNALLTLTYSNRSWACFSNFTWHVSLKRQPCPALLAWPKSPRSRSISTPRLYRSSGHGMSGLGVWNEVYEVISVSRSSFSRWELLGYQNILWNHWELFFILPEIISKPWQPWCSIPYLLGKL